MKKYFSLLVVLFSVSTVGFAESIAEIEQQKIEFLKTKLISSNCKFERNGKVYTGAKAVKHIDKKYDHFIKEIDSAEKFIELTASKSTISDKPYYILCEGSEKTKSSAWLNQKLVEFSGSE